MTIRISGEMKRKVGLGDLVQIKASLVGTFGLEFCYAAMLLKNSGVLHGLYLLMREAKDIHGLQGLRSALSRENPRRRRN